MRRPVRIAAHRDVLTVLSCFCALASGHLAVVPPLPSGCAGRTVRAAANVIFHSLVAHQPPSNHMIIEQGACGPLLCAMPYACSHASSGIACTRAPRGVKNLRWCGRSRHPSNARALFQHLCSVSLHPCMHPRADTSMFLCDFYPCWSLNHSCTGQWCHPARHDATACDRNKQHSAKPCS